MSIMKKRVIFLIVLGICIGNTMLLQAGLRRWVARMWDQSKEGAGQKAPTTTPSASSTEASSAAKTTGSSETTKSRAAAAA